MNAALCMSTVPRMSTVQNAYPAAARAPAWPDYCVGASSDTSRRRGLTLVIKVR